MENHTTQYQAIATWATEQFGKYPKADLRWPQNLIASAMYVPLLYSETKSLGCIADSDDCTERVRDFLFTLAKNKNALPAGSVVNDKRARLDCIAARNYARAESMLNKIRKHTLEYNRARSGTVQAHPSFTLQTVEVSRLMSDNMGKISAFLEKSEAEQMELIGDAWELPSGGRNVAVATLETIFGLL